MALPILGLLRPRSVARWSVGLIVAPALLGGLAAVDLVAAPQALAVAQTTQTFTTPGTSLFLVPAGVTAIQVTAVGGAGGSCYSGPGGRGGSVTAIIPVTAGFQLSVGVAGPGGGGGFCDGGGTTGGIGGGGNGGAGIQGHGSTGGGAGGGASIVSTGTGTPTLTSALVVAGGGGGGAYDETGGDAGSPGSSGNNGGGAAGGAGTVTAGGIGGAAEGGADATAGTGGTAFIGGAGGKGASSGFGAGAGGGGGGYYGGGGGGGSVNGAAGSGGGGSSYVKSTGYVVTAAAPTSSAASVSLTYPAVAPPSVSLSAPLTGGTYVLNQSVRTTFSCTEGAGGPGLASCDDDNGTNTASGGTGLLDTSFGGLHSYTVTASSSSGLTDAQTISYTVLIPPTATISSPATGGIYKLGQTVPTTFSCVEGAGGPGLVSCDDSTGSTNLDGGTGTLNTSTAGSHSYTVTARSDDGVTGKASISYAVSPAHVSIKTSSARVSAGKVKVVVACSGAMVCHGSLKLVHRKVVVAKTTYVVKGGASKTLKLLVTRAGMNLLHKAKTHRISTTATATVVGGAKAVRTIVVRR